MDNQTRKDVQCLIDYCFEFEAEDVIEVLINEPAYLEEGIVTEEEVETLYNSGDKDEIWDIVEKACDNTEFMHIYACAYRAHKALNK